MKIREASKADLLEWARMRNQLFPENLQSNLNELKEFFAGESIDIVQVYVIQVSPDALAGFIEINLRSVAEGSRCSPVPYIEAWFVDEKFRGRGYGKQLMSKAEEWAKQDGYTEIGSDTTLDNLVSQQLHRHLGYREVDRVVCFVKKLN